MRILLDENVRPSFAAFLSEHEVDHVDYLGLKSIGNGDLLDPARRDYDALITLDRGILFQHQHHGHRLIIAVLRVRDSTIESLQQRVEPLKVFLRSAQPGDTSEIGI